MAKDKKLTKSSTPMLDTVSRDLIQLAAEGKLDPVIGREEEISRIAQVLSRRRKNNPIIIGEPGSGKTAIVEGLAIKIQEGDVPTSLASKKLVSLDMTSIVAGTKYRGQFEERLKQIVDEIRNADDVIVFIDEIHTIMGAGNTNGGLDASNILKPALARGEFQCIGATTLDEYRENIEKDGALERRFQKVIIDGATPEETRIILDRIKDKYGDYHGVEYTDEALNATVLLAGRYITDREFPDKAIDIIDEVGAKAQLGVKPPSVFDELRANIDEVNKKKLQAVKAQSYEKASKYRDQVRELETILEAEKAEFEESKKTNKLPITEEMIFDVVAHMTKIPVAKLNTDDKGSLLNLENNLNQAVIGQSEAVKVIAKSIRRNRVGIKDPNRPIGSFIFLGSTGTGKTHLAKCLAREVFGSEDNLIRIDMSEFQEKHSLSRLIGSPPGYVGFDQGGQLTEAVKTKPYSVVLFDEVEKAHRDIFNTLLQMLDDGYLTDSFGRKINFRNTLIIMTSNLGVKKLQDFGTGVGFSTAAKTAVESEAKKAVLQKELRNYFAPEFLNRIDETVVFNSLDTENVAQIVRIELGKLTKRLADMNYIANIDDSVVDYIAEVGFDPKFGARPVKRAIQDQIEDLISEEVLKGNIEEGKKFKVKMKKGEVAITKR